MTHLLAGSDYDATTACGADGPAVANIDEVDCQECKDVWEDWAETNDLWRNTSREESAQ